MLNWLDFIGASLSLISTYYFTQAKRIAWLIGIAAIVLNIFLYAQKGIYGHLLLEGIYFISMIIGIIQWSQGTTKNKVLAIRSLRLKEACFYSIFAFCVILLLAQGLIRFTNSDIPYWDATTTVLCLLAQWLLCLKVIHCWILWFIVDAMVATLQLYKGIPFHSAIHWMYLIMAIMGYYRWHKIANNPQHAFI